jgi:hypothetical protein
VVGRGSWDRFLLIDQWCNFLKLFFCYFEVYLNRYLELSATGDRQRQYPKCDNYCADFSYGIY